MKTVLVAVGALAALAIIARIGLSRTTFQAAETTPVTAVATVTIGNQVLQCEVAATQAEQQLGLGQRASLAANNGMIFPISPPAPISFWMKDMQFPIDIVWIRSGTVVGVTANVPAPAPNTPTDQLPTYAPPHDVDNVLEINAGASQGITLGSVVSINYHAQS